jgi:glucose-6-phosphate dehydrogenase assembly protein OpcA
VEKALSESPSQVMARVDRELREMWSPSSGAPRWRACTMNLVVGATSMADAERFTPIVDAVTRSIPARAIVVALDPDGSPDALEGDVTAVCGVGDGASVCSERVRLIARGGVCARAANAVDAVREPEMPTALVWLGSVHEDDPIFVGLAEGVQRIVVDTEQTSLANLVMLARWAQSEPDPPKIADLAWTRLAVWQEMCARFFDVPGLNGHAGAVAKLTLTQASPKGARIASPAALLLTWIATRLGWRATRVGGRLRFERADKGAVVVELKGNGATNGGLYGVALEATVNGVPMRGSITRESSDDGTDVLAWRLDTPVPSPTEQRVRVHASDDGIALARTLQRPARDLALVAAVALAEELADDAIVCS